MKCLKKITEDIYWVGGNDRRLALFENLFPLPNGVSYNSYLILDEKIALMDTVDAAISRQYFENIDALLEGKEVDYLVVHHMEPDHCANIDVLFNRYPKMKIVANSKSLAMINQFYQLDLGERVILVKEGDTLSLGQHELQFILAPMVHWPEVMVSFEKREKILFSADAFGTFGALNGNIFSDQMDFDRDWIDESRRYYTNIVGKFGMQVQSLLKKAASLDIKMICPLHGPVWRNNIDYILDKYQSWSSYQPEDSAVLIVYGSIYGNTENVADITASMLGDRGIKDVRVYDVSKTPVSNLIAEAFRCSHIVLACSTYNMGIFPPMEAFVNDMKALNLQNRTVAIIENGTWACAAGKLIKGVLEQMKNMKIISTPLFVKSTLRDDQLEDLCTLVDEIVASGLQ